MSERTTKTITTPQGKECVMKDFLTMREIRAISNAPLKFSKVDFREVPDERNPGKKNLEKHLKEFDAEGAISAEDDELIRQAILSYDGSPATILERILDSVPAEYRFILAEAQKLLLDDPS